LGTYPPETERYSSSDDCRKRDLSLAKIIAVTMLQQRS